MDNILLKNSETIEFEITTGGKSKIMFPTENRFKGRKITGIEFVSGASGQKSLNGNSMATIANLQNVFLTLDIKGAEKVKDLPASLMHRGSTGGRIIQFDNAEVNPSKSFVSVSDMSGVTSTLSIVMVVYFND